MLIPIPPKYAVSEVVGFIKGQSAMHLARVCVVTISATLIFRRTMAGNIDALNY
jgi:hypothetical protein